MTPFEKIVVVVGFGLLLWALFGEGLMEAAGYVRQCTECGMMMEPQGWYGEYRCSNRECPSRVKSSEAGV